MKDLIGNSHLLLPLLRPHAYLDPGSGSFLIQLLIGALVAVGFTVRMFWGKIKAFFNRNKNDDGSSS